MMMIVFCGLFWALRVPKNDRATDDAHGGVGMRGAESEMCCTATPTHSSSSDEMMIRPLYYLCVCVCDATTTLAANRRVHLPTYIVHLFCFHAK